MSVLSKCYANLMSILCQNVITKSVFFQPFFVFFFIITTISNAQKRFSKNSPHNVQTKGGGGSKAF